MVATNRLHIQAEAQQNSNRASASLAFENRIVMLACQAKRLG